MKKAITNPFRKALLLGGLFVFLLQTAFSQTHQVRVLNPVDPTTTYQYDVVFNGSAATVTRELVPSTTEDSTGTYVIGATWSFIQTTQQLILPNIAGKDWFGVDEDFTGGTDVVVGGGSGITVSCPCESHTDGVCDAKASGGCVKCYARSNCLQCDKPTAQGVFSAFVPLLINASDITFDTTSVVTSTTIEFRKINPADSLQTFVYIITLYSNNSVEVLRSTDVAVVGDKEGVQIIGEGASFNQATNELYLPQTVGMYWHFVDNGGTGDVYAAIGGTTLEITCPCKKKAGGDCDVAMQMDGCLYCVASTETCRKCGDLVIVEIEEEVDYSYHPYLIIQAASVTFATQ